VLIRYADDLLIVFAAERDARRVEEVLPKRVARYGLQLHPEKTRLVHFQIPRDNEKPTQSNGPGAFTFLGFTHYWGRSRKGNWVVKRKTAASRLTRSMSRVRQWCRRWRHESVPWQQRRLSLGLRGHYAYYGIMGNYQALDNFHRQVTREWRKWLNRRSQKARMTWVRFNRLLITYPLPRPRIVHAI